ncbi:ATP phosphoribosyltransferase regulatory subunit, partial [Candidatus Peregrinibacteria bacterium]|nr:ATP phosphoribosyltransferase regulatory subunit [Candidatus Peregrinibacteria bacterium]
MEIKAPQGTQDILPEKIALWNRIEGEVKRLFPLYCYQEIRTPILEYTKLFDRAIGETAEIVEKEMYVFHSQSDEEDNLCLRPELTAPTMRMIIENNLYKKRTFQKFFYIG